MSLKLHKTRKVRVPAHRKKLLKKEAPLAVREAIMSLGLFVQEAKARLNVYTHRNGTLLGHFEWVPHNGYQLFIATPILRTRTDISVALDDIKGLGEAHAAVQVAWDLYAKTHSTKCWDEYMGALAAFYMRAFAPAVSTSAPSSQSRLAMVG